MVSVVLNKYNKYNKNAAPGLTLVCSGDGRTVSCV